MATVSWVWHSLQVASDCKHPLFQPNTNINPNCVPSSRLLSIRYLIPELPYIGIILLEPSLIDAETWYSKDQPMFRAMFAFMKKGANSRLDSWPTKEEAAKYLKKTIPYSLWDDRILELYIVRFMPRLVALCEAY